MAATQQEIDNYLQSARYAVSDYSALVSRKEMLGHTDTFCDRLKLILVTDYLEILEDYFAPGITYATNNFFTTEEIEDVMQHVNAICKTDYILETL